MSNVIPFKGIGLYVEELVQYAGANQGLISIRWSEDEGFSAAIGCIKAGKKYSEQSNSDTFNKCIKSLHEEVLGK